MKTVGDMDHRLVEFAVAVNEFLYSPESVDITNHRCALTFALLPLSRTGFQDAQDLGVSTELLPLTRPNEEFNVLLFYADFIGLDGDEIAQFMPLAGEKSMIRLKRLLTLPKKPHIDNYQGYLRLFTFSFAVAFYRSSSRSQLVGLVTQEELTGGSCKIEPPGLHMKYLPYSDDMRQIEEARKRALVFPKVKHGSDV
ncbi:hypothetical protein L2E82_20672 [Cichorium intybus]|uniref:Uncharacterized protein n=1 Tax=Cichorium intybus TaxID=13427 RepID=A0ACB9DUS1_CICIN|nr:hypothetical protein L2E82_20672 [Cichorium intybus]